MFSIIEPIVAGVICSLINKYIINKLNCQYCENNEVVESIDEDEEHHHIPAVIFHH